MSVTPGRNRLRGRRVILWTLGTFLVLQFAAGLFFDWICTRIRFPSLNVQLSRISQTSAPPQVVCLGSSRIGSGFLETEVTRQLREATGDASVRAFNAHIPAGDLITCEYVLGKLLDHGVRPRLLVVEVSPEMLARWNVWMGAHVRRQFGWWDGLANVDEIARSGDLLRLVSNRVVPLYVHRREIWRQCYLAMQGTPFDVLTPGGEQVTFLASDYAARQGPARPNVPVGLVAAFASDTPRPLPAKTGIAAAEESSAAPTSSATQATPAALTAGLQQIRRWLKNYRVGGASAAALERLLERCRAEKIDVVLVAPPLASTHRALYTPEIETAFRAHLDQLTRTYGCRFHDYRDRLPDRCFQDHHHMLGVGAITFSRDLTREVLTPAWVKRQ